MRISRDFALVLFFFCLPPSAAAGQSPLPADSIAARATYLIDVLRGEVEGELDPLWDPATVEEMPTERVEEAWATVVGMLGSPSEVPPPTVEPDDEGGWVARFSVVFPLTPLPVAFMFDEAGHVRGVSMGG